MNRQQILERLRLGRAIEAELAADGEGRRAFIQIRPQIDPHKAEFRHIDFGVEPVLIRAHANADVNSAYRVRYCSLDPGWESEPNDWDQYLHKESTAAYGSLDELESALLGLFCISLDAFVTPGSIESPF